MKYTIGLDLGTTSVGWAVVDPEGQKIIDLGVRIFDSAENPKDGKSLAEPRRNARSARRRLARRGYRLDGIKDIFTEHRLLSHEEIKNILGRPNNPYQLRAEGLDRSLTAEELLVAVYHLAKRRGYKSNRKNQTEDKDVEGRLVLSGITDNKKRLQDIGCRTVGEMLYRDLIESERSHEFIGVRNRPGDYRYSFSREMLTEELQMILKRQKELKNIFVEKIEGELLSVFSFQRHYAQGDILRKMIGFCEFEYTIDTEGKKIGEIRAAKASYSFQYFRLLQSVNHLQIIDEFGKSRPLTDEERFATITKSLETKDINYGQLRKWLSLLPTDRFNISYFVSKKELEGGKTLEELKDSHETKTRFVSMSDYYNLNKVLVTTDKNFADLAEEDKGVYDALADILTHYKTDKDILEHLRQVKTVSGVAVPEKVQQALLKLSFSKVGHLSLKALSKIIPHFEKGLTYDKAVAAAYPKLEGRFGERTYKLRPLSKDDHTLTNPVVRRTVSQTIKVVNAIIDKYGSPYNVHIELARDLSKNHTERAKLEKSQAINRKRNEDAVEMIKKLGISDPLGQDIVRYKLWQEQNGQCAYSGKPIPEQRLYEQGLTEIDHIIPFSRSFDDSYNNKVLVITSENQEKLNKLPYEAWGHDDDRWQTFANRVESMPLPFLKKRNLLRKSFVLDELTSRTLNDTRYQSRFIKNYLERTLQFAEGEKKRRVVTVNGATTAYLRSRWGMNKVREENDRHHAQDAAVVAVTDESLIKKVSDYSKIGKVKKYLKNHKTINDSNISPEEIERAKELNENEKLASQNRFPEPWRDFAGEVEAGLKEVFVSRMPRRKSTGQAHKDTLRSPKLFSEGKSTVRKPLTSLKRKDIEANKKTIDPGIYDQLLNRLDEFADNPEKAFAEPFYKIRKDGTNGPVVRTLNIVDESQKSGLLINNGQSLVDRSSMIRVDIFSKKNTNGKDEFYFIPVYAHHTVERELPNKVVVSGGPDKWREIDETYTFKFSLYPNDLLRTEKGGEVVFWYYVKAGVASGTMTVDSPDRSARVDSMGIKTLDKLDKYVVDVLGRYHLVKQEARQTYN